MGMDAPTEKLTQFCSVDRKLIIQDIEFWKSSLDALLRFYDESGVDSDESKAAKAVACGRLAGFGQAMSEHFSAGVEAVIDVEKETPELEATEAAGVGVYEMCDHHTKRLETLARAQLN